MKKRIIALALAMVLAMSGMLYGCGDSNKPSTGTDDKTGTTQADSTPAEGDDEAATSSKVGLAGDPSETYYMNVFVSGVEYWFPVYAGMKDACKQLGVNCSYGGTTEYDPQGQAESFESMVSMGAKGILVSPITAEAFQTPISNAIKSGTAVVTYASDSQDSGRAAYITSDNENEGIQAARAIAKEIGGKGKVMVVRNPGQTNHDIRCDVFIKTMNDEFPDIEIVADEPTNQSAEKAYSAMMTVTQMHPDLAAAFSPESVSATGLVQANKELGGKIKIMCCDTSDELLDALKAGDLFAILCPDQYLQGYFGMISLFLAAHPENLNPMTGRKDNGENPFNIPFIDNGLTIVTAETADYYYISKYAEKLGYTGIDDMLSEYKVAK